MTNQSDDNINISITDYAGEVKTFTRLTALISLLEEEAAFWEGVYKSMDSNKPNDVHLTIQEGYSYIPGILAQIEELIKNKETVNKDEELNYKITEITCDGYLHERWLWSNHDYTKSFIECQKKTRC